MPRPSALYVDFLPVLEERHVPRDVLRDVVESQLKMDFSALLEAFDCPVKLRRWIHSHMSRFEENNRTGKIQAVGGLPADSFEKVVALLESGFHPTKDRFLAECADKVVKLWLAQMRQRLKVRLGKSTSAYGIADPSGCLQPGEILLAFSKTFNDEESGGSWPYLKGRFWSPDIIL